jgi:hypothetical protein
MRTHFACKLVFIALMLLLGAGNGSADLYFETEQVTRGIPGQADGSAILKQYLTMDASRSDVQDGVTIVDFNKKLIYQLDPAAKTYTRSDITSFNAIPGMDGDAESGEQNQMVKAMIESMANSIRVTPTDEYREIAGYKCRKFNVTIMMATSEYWASKDFKGYDELMAIGEKASAVFANNPMMKQMNILGLMKEVDGFPVQTMTQVMGGTVVSTLKTMQQKPLSKSLFQVPEGYRLARTGE